MMDRRVFTLAGAAMALTPAGAVSAQSRRRGRAAQSPAPRASVIDAMAIGGAGSVDGPEVLAAGMDALVLDLTIFPRAPTQATTALENWNAFEGAADSKVRLVRAKGDLERARAEGKLAVIVACQDANIVGPSVISYSDLNLETFRGHHAKGLRVLQLTHNERSPAGDGFMEPTDGGLSLLGAALIWEMEAAGGLIDLSHCSPRTTLEAIEHARGPIAVTHAGCRALYDTPRNKSDEMIRKLADKGGFFGVFMMSRWLTAADHSSVEDVVDHIDHAVRVGGVDCVGFGSDQPAMGDSRDQATKVANLADYQRRNLGRAGAEPLAGHVTCADMDGPDRMQVLDAALRRRGYGDTDRAKILGGNFARVLEASLK
ncbi:dipeptidase [Brevundimonas sp. GCM10030266]|uniref:dipeptidase n=1 Tax=Brevundimonas sp. GCM10030266 TaxID=3273386 RepID=UPI003615BF44